MRANVKNLSDLLKSAVEFMLTNFFTPSAADLAIMNDKDMIKFDTFAKIVFLATVNLV